MLKAQVSSSRNADYFSNTSILSSYVLLGEILLYPQNDRMRSVRASQKASVVLASGAKKCLRTKKICTAAFLLFYYVSGEHPKQARVGLDSVRQNASNDVEKRILTPRDYFPAHL